MAADSLNTKLKNALRIDRAIRFVWQASPRYALLSGGIVLIQGILPLVSLFLVKLIIDSVTQIATHPDHSFFSPSFSSPLTYIIMACAIGLLAAVFNFFSDYIKKAQALTVTDHMLNVLHEKSAQADLGAYDSPAYRDTLFRAQREGPFRPTSIVNGLFAAGQSGASFAAVFWLLFTFNPLISFAMIAAAVPGVLLRLKYSQKIYLWQEKSTEADRRSNYFHWMLTGDNHAKEIRLFNLGNHFIEQFKTIRKRLKSEKLFFEKRRALGDFIAQACVTLTVFAAFAFIALKTGQGRITLGDMVMYFQGFQKGLGFLKTFLESGAQMYEDNLFLSRFHELMTISPQISSPEKPVSMPRKNRKGYEFKNVEFFYPINGKKVLKRVNFYIKPGETLALVGDNGSGKSTIAKLLPRLYDPSAGQVLYEGTDIRSFDLNTYRNTISTVLQDHNRYNLSVRENIYMGDISRCDDTPAIEQAARQAEIQELIRSLPHGYDTLLGRWFSNSSELSTGQWQMMAIARAFFRKARLIIMDEPSSALDPMTEMHLFKRLKTLINDRSALIISHRYATVRMADRIIVLDQGQIIEQGTHQELIRLDGKYAAAYNAQAASYISP